MCDYGFFSTFALVNELERHIEILLLSNDCVIVPGFGGFMAHHVDARYDGRDKLFLPPLRTVGFNPQLKMNDSLLAQAYVEAYDISYPEALDRLEDEVAEMRQCLENEGKLELNHIGVIYLNEDGNYSFEPCEAGILTPALYGLGGFDMLPLDSMAADTMVELEIAPTNATPAQKENDLQKDKATVAPFATANTVFDTEEEDNGKHAEFILVKKSWLRNLAAACIAIIAFFAISTPLKTPNLQASKVDTSLLTRIMPKELVQGGHSGNVQLGQNSSGASSMKITDSQAQNEQADLNSAKPYYSIVLASRITKRNAASYVEQLQAKGLKDAKVVITPSNVKVVYGIYETENEAYKALNSLRHNEIFSDSWVTKVTD